ncbi:expressed protein [Chlorella variabilis]|uniref:Expressed protein n=1 Tax=Chlorella variabilis TaxID=554065 RepID=E1ZAG4_CHLVA|nr:expressed protein [Chlorella variabilis]EFN57055.1 expressed protein [Chlorella variabilis]|eukprot:XP_005849157.1 expressed protein [Chlorella variabilis]
MAANGQELLLPDDPEAACTAATMFEATSKEHECSKTLYHREEAVESCCQVLAEYYGPNSTLPSRNCFCVESYWTPFIALADKSYIGWTSYFDTCTEMGYTIHYWHYGEGPCVPPPASDDLLAPAPAPVAALAEAPSPAAELGAAVEEVVSESLEDPLLPMPMRPFNAWASDLDSDGWGMASFVMAWVAVLGSSAMAWTFLFDAFVDFRRCCGSRRAAG